MSAGKEGALKGARFPGRYLQGPGYLAHLGDEAAIFGSSALIILDAGIYSLYADEVTTACKLFKQIDLQRHGGDCTEAEIARLVDRASTRSAEVVIGIGGGKALDTAKAVAHHLELTCVVVPTIAASDAPCSALAVVYGEDGSVAYDLFLPRNPDLVIVDTALIAKAPPRFLVAGMGDALATFYEADACRRSGANNVLGLTGLPVAYELARFCRDTLFEHGFAALQECREKTAGPALERIVEANILLSGLGFESGGVAAAHAIHHGLCELHETHGFLHGEKVALGVLAELLLQEVPPAVFSEVLAFCLKIGLPTRLADLGIVDPSLEMLQRIAARACREGEIIHNEPFPVTSQRVVEVLQRLL
ncbi:glycerol dehydrogenase [Pseudomonas versuta]|uniref:Glycerol dehydrogenase n=1 Tax=Pseudomonas versuta TaxID=1788301 RepID=A0A0M4QHF2_9PSED|nr:glycerol dehydrogenase [Pseudomonas versuta]ALE87828.1 glycerol dehydrogenase [Pseudomonas versuta]OKA19082.1 glycerol dehydrogenase [Pseudomonas versuta]OKA20913.1 glycerol dehydrogenase [Pseudomonas versuta]